MFTVGTLITAAGPKSARRVSSSLFIWRLQSCPGVWSLTVQKQRDLDYEGF